MKVWVLEREGMGGYFVEGVYTTYELALAAVPPRRVIGGLGEITIVRSANNEYRIRPYEVQDEPPEQG